MVNLYDSEKSNLRVICAPPTPNLSYVYSFIVILGRALVVSYIQGPLKDLCLKPNG